jgi:hypothetical protein
VDLSDVEQVLMDEFAIQKGHRYATVVGPPPGLWTPNLASQWTLGGSRHGEEATLL